jgi:hypothetical protein
MMIRHSYAEACISMRLRHALSSAMQGVSRGVDRGRRQFGQVPEAM